MFIMTCDGHRNVPFCKAVLKIKKATPHSKMSMLLVSTKSQLIGIPDTKALGRYLNVWVTALEATSSCRKCKCFPAHQQCRHMILLQPFCSLVQ